MTIRDEESLRNALINDDHSEFWFQTSWVLLCDRSLKLRNLRFKHLTALGITNTVSVDDEIGGRESLGIILDKGSDGLRDGLPHTLLHNLLTFPLNQVLTVVLGHFLVNRCRETDNAVGATSMRNIDTDQHGALALQTLRELQVIEITAGLAVNLAQNIGGLRQIELGGVSGCDDLAGHSVLVHHFFEGFVG